MGRYLDLMQNMSIGNFNFSETISNDTTTQAIDSANSFTGGWLGIGILTPIWFGLYNYLSKRENLFELSQIQALVSTNALIFTLAIALVFS